MAKAKGVQPITKAGLALPKVNVPGLPKQAKAAPLKTNLKSLQALFGKKPSKTAIQGTPTKTPAL